MELRCVRRQKLCRWCTLIIDISWLLQNFALNVADHGFKISVYNRSYEKTEAAVKRAQKEGARCDADI